VLPVYAEKAMALFGEREWTWASLGTVCENCTLGAYEYLASRIDGKQVDAMTAAATINPGDSGEVSHESRASKNKAKAPAAPAADVPAVKPEIAFADFDKLDLRVGVVEACEIVPKSSKLLKFTLNAGPLGRRVIFSGIRPAYPEPESLVGREVVFVANLAPRKMSVGTSEGMILFAGEPGAGGGVLVPTAPAGAGTPAT
jgi:methionyl-tRNA synthetase